MQTLSFELRGEFITLDRLLKATGIAGSGGQAKALVSEGKVQVDGRDELRKTAKLHAGQVVALHGVRIRLLPPAAPEVAGAAAVAGASEIAAVDADAATDAANPPAAAGPAG